MFEKPKRKVNKVFIHCSASDNPDHDTIANFRQTFLTEIQELFVQLLLLS